MGQATRQVDFEGTDQYQALRLTLSSLREEFHRTGRFDDSNAKLDEIVKLLAVRLYESNRNPDRFSVEWLDKQTDGSKGVALALRQLSEEVLSEPLYLNSDGTSVFGTHPRLNLQPTDDDFAITMVEAIRSIPAPGGQNSAARLDLLNEAFGHFVRDSFRNHKEDAQYMTPVEVIDSMFDMAFADIARDDGLESVLHPSPEQRFIIADPTCGVGSFLVGALRRILHLAVQQGMTDEELNRLVTQYRDHYVFGQDKVDRMVRLAKLNFMMFGGGSGQILQGNSIFGTSPLDELLGKVSLIVTNPPFGAECTVAQLAKAPNFRLRYPMIAEWCYKPRAKVPTTIDSELLMLDRAMALLKPGGRLLVVLPDSVISAKGIYAQARAWIERNAEIRGVIELPAVAFAQAGTRTKTCVLYLQKLNAVDHSRIFMGVCSDIGFTVVERGGIPVKQVSGHNELEDISSAYEHGSASNDTYEVVSEEPACIWTNRQGLINGRWTPNFYQPKRLEAMAELSRLDPHEFEIRNLEDVAQLCSRSRRVGKNAPTSKSISVLHVRDDGTVDLKQVLSYDPKTLGLMCHPGEVLFSKINPRIPRVCVVPELNMPLTCSSEFEILKPQAGLSPNLLVSLLLTPLVQHQLQCLTSGTSSSHNRIKDAELALVQIPLPRPHTAARNVFDQLAAQLQKATANKYLAETELEAARSQLASALSKTPAPAVDTPQLAPLTLFG